MEWDDEGLGDEPASPLLPPDDRLWRHPSEVAGAPAAPPAAVRTTGAPGVGPRVVTAVALTSCLSVLLTIGVVSVVRPFRVRVPTTEPAPLPASARTAGGAGELADDGPSIADLTSKVRPAIAQVVARTATGERSAGSGVLIRSDGLLLTTHHVVAGADAVRVVLDDGRDLLARLVGADPDTDIAVLDLEGDAFPTAALAADRTAMKVGDRAFTIGASSQGVATGPLVRASMVSAMNQEAGMDGRKFVDVIRTDAAVAPGCSGGAVVDSRGHVIGIAVSNMTTEDGAIGFATPIDVARSVAEQLVGTGRVVRGWLGVDGATEDGRAVVRAVRPTSPAELAGIRPGDVVAAIDGAAMPTMAAVVVRLRSHRPGEVVTLRVQRDGATLDIPVALGDRPQTS